MYSTGSPHIMDVASTLQGRYSSRKIDAVSAFAYLLQLSSIPTYDENMDVENAWNRLVTFLPAKHLTDLLFLYSASGDGILKWRPSWKQLVPRAGRNLLWHRQDTYFESDKLDSNFSHNAYLLSHPVTVEWQRRQGTRRFTWDLDGEVTASHMDMPYGLPDGTFTVVVSHDFRFWIFAKLLPEGEHSKSEVTVEKVFSIRITYEVDSEGKSWPQVAKDEYGFGASTFWPLNFGDPSPELASTSCSSRTRTMLTHGYHLGNQVAKGVLRLKKSGEAYLFELKKIIYT